MQRKKSRRNVSSNHLLLRKQQGMATGSRHDSSNTVMNIAERDRGISVRHMDGSDLFAPGTPRAGSDRPVQSSGVEVRGTTSHPGTQPPPSRTVTITLATIDDYLPSSKGGSVASDGLRQDSWSLRAALTAALQGLAIKHPHVAGGLMDPTKHIALLTPLRSAHVVMALGVVRQPAAVTVIREHVAGGTLNDLLASRGLVLEPSQKLQILLDIAKGLVYLKNIAGLANRGKGGSSGKTRSAAIAPSVDPEPQSDLYGRLLPTNVFLDRQLNAKLGVDLGLPMSTPGEILTYSAPEVLSKGLLTAAADVYSLGILAYDMFNTR